MTKEPAATADTTDNNSAAASRARLAAALLNDYGMLIVLVLLCVFFSIMTWDQYFDTGPSGVDYLTGRITQTQSGPATVLIAGRESDDDVAFIELMKTSLEAGGHRVAATVNGSPRDARKALEAEGNAGVVNAIVCTPAAADWGVFDNLGGKLPDYKGVAVLSPPSYQWPAFLTAGNLRNVASQISVIAIVAIGMTMVIITGGIDLSVGSLIALSAVVTASCIRACAGTSTAPVDTVACALIGIIVCASAGSFNGTMVTLLKVPPFIVTLSQMLALSGAAYILADGQSIEAVPAHITWLGRGADLFGVPNSVVLMLLLYAVAHVVMTYTIAGRYIYAVGGNAEAARLSGVPVNRVVLLVYTICGALAGLGGVVMASQLKSGAPTYGQMYELYVIAAVVVGGASLAGGEGKILGTLIGAFIIAVIQNGMNLTNVESYTQKVVLGSVILGAVIIDRLRHGADWRRLFRAL